MPENERRVKAGKTTKANISMCGAWCKKAEEETRKRRHSASGKKGASSSTAENEQRTSTTNGSERVAPNKVSESAHRQGNQRVTGE